MALIKPINFVEFIFKILFYLGISPGNPSVPYKIYGGVIFVIFFGVYDILLIGEMLNSKNFNEMVYSGACAIGMMVVGGRHLTLYVYSENVNIILKELLEHFTADETLFRDVNIKLKRFNTFANIFFATVLMTVTGVFFLPLVSSSKLLPYKIWFPFDVNGNVIVLISSKIYAIICMSLFGISTLSTLLIWYLMFNVSIRYDTFGSQLKSLSKEENGQDVSSCKELIGFIKFHLRIRKTVDVIRACFNTLFLFQLTTSGICICCGLYVMVFANKNNFTEFIIYGILSFYFIFEILAIMYFGNEITLKSSKLSYCLYESNWINRSQAYKKIMVMCMEVLKKPETVILGKLFPLSLDIFMSIMRISYSSFNILRSFSE